MTDDKNLKVAISTQGVMMELKELNLKKSYSSDTDDILNQFYIPALSCSTEYKRLAGFFSSTSLAVVFSLQLVLLLQLEAFLN